MAKKVKSKYLGARVDEDFYGSVEVYADAAEISMGDLTRKALREYMANHPLEPSKLSKVEE